MPTRRFFVNNATQQLISAQITSGATTLTAPSFATWPTQFPFYATLEIGTSAEEIVSVTNIVGTTATIVRAQDGSAAISHLAGATFDFTVVAKDLDEANLHTSSNTGVHGVSGAVVGATDVQTLTNKTLASPTITGTSAGANETLSGTLAVTGAVTASSTLVVTGGLTAGSVTSNSNIFTSTGTIQGAKLLGVVVPTSFANEAAAGTATLGNIVWLTTPTTAGYTAGFYRGNGTIWVPIDRASDANAFQTLLFTPGVNTDTPGAGTATWLTLGNVTVPGWATKCVVTYTLNGVYCIGAASNTTSVVKVGAATGAVSKIISHPGVANQRFHLPTVDTLTGLTSGSQSVTISATWASGSVVRADTTSFITAAFTFLP